MENEEEIHPLGDTLKDIIDKHHTIDKSVIMKMNCDQILCY